MLWRLQCLKYKTDQAADVKKLEKLNALFLSFMARGTDSSPGALPCAACVWPNTHYCVCDTEQRICCSRKRRPSRAALGAGRGAGRELQADSPLWLHQQQAASRVRGMREVGAAKDNQRGRARKDEDDHLRRTALSHCCCSASPEACVHSTITWLESAWGAQMPAARAARRPPCSPLAPPPRCLHAAASPTGRCRPPVVLHLAAQAAPVPCPCRVGLPP